MSEFNFGEPKENFFEGCRVGVGESVKSIKSFKILEQEMDKKFDLSPFFKNQTDVPLTPPTTSHSIFEDESVWNRGVNHNRSFQRKLLSKDGGTYTLVVKGGDVYNSEGFEGQMSRVARKQIPGASIEEGSLTEFKSAVILQTLALEKLKRLTNTAMPVDIRRIKKLQNKDGQVVDIRIFMNSEEYPQVENDDLREVLKIPKGIKMGDLLLGKYGLTPTEYLYAVDGQDIRSNEITSLLFFDIGNDEIADDPLAWPESGLFKYGVYLEHKGRGYDESVRAVYKTVGNAYGVNVNFLPKNTIDKTNYIQSLRQVRRNCWESGVGRVVLNKFIDSVTETAALGHSSGYVFSEPDVKTGGSLITRNVTFKGSVLDLDTFRQRGSNEWSYVAKDFEEMLLSVACIARLVSYERPKELFEMVQYDYLKKFIQFSDNKQDRVDVARAVYKGNLKSEILESL